MARSLKASKAKAEALCRRLVFHRAQIAAWDGAPPTTLCEWRDETPPKVRCVREPTDWAHIIPRRFSATRCEPDNAWALCRLHHGLVDKDPEAKRELARLTIGLDRYHELRQLAYAGLAGVQLSPLMFWRGEEERLELECKAKGLPTTLRGTPRSS